MPEDVDAFRVCVTVDRRCTEVAVVGEIDLISAPLLRRELAAVVASEPQVVVLDLSAVPFIDSAGIAEVLWLYRHLRAAGGELQLGPLSETAARTLEVAGVLDQLPRSGNVTADG